MALLVVLTTAVLLGANSCGLKSNITRTKRLFGGEFLVQAQVAPNANMNTPVAVEFLIVYDDKLMETLAKTNAKDWFTNRKQFRQDNLKDYESWYWEWVPGQQTKDERIPMKPGAKGAFVFANYAVAGDNRAKLEPNRSVTITLNERAFTATQD